MLLEILKAKLHRIRVTEACLDYEGSLTLDPDDMEAVGLVPYEKILVADVENGKWYTDAVRWAAANEIVIGYGDGRFGPNDELTREQLATILYRYAGMRGRSITGTQALPLTFDDASDVSDWACESMCWMTMNGVIIGVGDNRLSPRGIATRAQVAAMLMRFEAIEQ